MVCILIILLLYLPHASTHTMCCIVYMVTAKSVTDVDEFTKNHQECIVISRLKMKSKTKVKLWLQNYFALGE